MTGAWAAAVGLALVSNLIYVDVATAEFALRSAFDLGSLIPLMSDSHFGKGYLTLELCLLLFAFAGRRRDLARPAGAANARPGGCCTHRSAAGRRRGHPRPRRHRPRRPTFAARRRHSGRLDPYRGRLGLDRRADRPAGHRVHGLGARARPGRPAFLDRGFLLGHRAGRRRDRQLAFPPADVRVALETSYGKMVLVKIAVLAIALLIVSVNFLRNAPRLRAAERRPDLVHGAANLLYKLVSVEIGLVVGIIFCAALLTSLARLRRRWRRRGRRTRPSGRARSHAGRAKGYKSNSSRAQPRRRPERLCDQGDQGRQAGDRGARHDRVLDAGHGDGHAVVQLP